MSYRLKDRQRQVPNGYKFLQPQTNWQSPFFASFNVIVSSLIAHRKANPHLVKQHGWRTDEAGVADEVDEYNARICAQNGWTQYIMAPLGEPPPPKSKPPTIQDQKQLSAAGLKAAKVWSGVKTLNEWYDSQEPAVPAELSIARAKACSECPFNEPGDYSKWFVAPAAEAIKRQVEKFSDRKLSTPYDDKLQVCKACLCVNKLSVHAPLRLKLAHMRPDVYAELETAPDCWVVRERKEIN